MNIPQSSPTPNGTINPEGKGVTPRHGSSGQQEGRSSPSQSRVKFSTFNPCGIRVQAITVHGLLSIISEAVLDQRRYVVANHNMHSLYLWLRDPKMRALHARADFTHIDGFPLIPLFRLCGAQLKREHRTGYIDFLPMLASEAIRQEWRIYYLGSRPDVVEQGAARLRVRYPGLQLCTHHGYFDTHGAENEAVLSDINAYAPDVLLVGMGMPRQEEWINDNLNHIAARAIFCCGCMMDYVAGKISTCPRWLSSIGFEWLYRLLAEPTRLWCRYLVEPWFVLGQLGSAYLNLGRRFGTSSSTIEEVDE
jgi:N-acetylglucosaminyldiphosphoundecaprenol N-acetyl-beta-D-mannosaminyltransferase